MTLTTELSRIHVSQSGLWQPDEQAAGLTSTLLGRKGLLSLLALPDIPTATAERLVAAYYSSPRFDVGRSLSDALVEAYDADQSLGEHLGGAIVVLGMDVYIVATPGVVAWIVGYDTVQRAFDVSRRVGLPAEGGKRPSYAVDWEVHVAHWRLTAGDLLVAVVADQAISLDDEQVAKLASRHGEPRNLAAAVAKSLLKTGDLRGGALVCAAGGFAPVPASPNETVRPQRVRPIDDNWGQRRGLSPILIALVLAALAILITVRLAGQGTTMAALREYGEMVFGQEPTPTPSPEPTATPAQTVVALLAAPALVSPEPGARLSEASVELSWTWGQRLSPNQIYEVRVARAGQSLVAIDKTAESQTVYAPDRAGWYEWAVVVVSDQESGAARQFSELSSLGGFFWSASGAD